MNKLEIIGNLTRDPETRVATNGETVTTFTVACNRPGGRNDHPVADFFRVSCWGRQGESCAKYLSKGKKVFVRGAVTANAYTDRQGTLRASMDVTASEVEFLTPKGDAGAEDAAEDAVEAAPKTDQQNGFTAVETDETPF